jgi:rRNA-processing protein FCF1
MEIVLDTNFILTCAKQGIDFVSLTNKLIDEGIVWVVPQDVLNELGYLKDSSEIGYKDREAARLGFEILQAIDVQVIELKGKNPNVDIKIVNYLLDNKRAVLATLDKDLKKRVKNKILGIKGKSGLVLI